MLRKRNKLEGNSRQDPKSHASRIAKSGREKASGRSADDVGCTTNELRLKKNLQKPLITTAKPTTRTAVSQRERIDGGREPKLAYLAALSGGVTTVEKRINGR